MRKDLSHSNRPHGRGLNPTRPVQNNRQQLKLCAGCWNSSCELAALETHYTCGSLIHIYLSKVSGHGA